MKSKLKNIEEYLKGLKGKKGNTVITTSSSKIFTRGMCHVNPYSFYCFASSSPSSLDLRRGTVTVRASLILTVVVLTPTWLRESTLPFAGKQEEGLNLVVAMNDNTTDAYGFKHQTSFFQIKIELVNNEIEKKKNRISDNKEICLCTIEIDFFLVGIEMREPKR